MQTVRVVTAPESLTMSMVKLILLVIGVAVVLTAMAVGGNGVYGEVVQYRSPVYAAEFSEFTGFWSVLADIWFALKVFAWCIVALAVSAVVLFAMLSLGVLSWVFQLIFGGIAKISDMVRSQWSAVKPLKPSASIAMSTEVVAYRDGVPVLLPELARDLVTRVRALELAIMSDSKGAN